jgi:hypothetical protein
VYQKACSFSIILSFDFGNSLTSHFPVTQTVVLWLADQAGYHVGLADSIQIVIVATLSSMGASPTPGLTPAIILVWSTCFPQYPVPDAIAYCMALDWLLDRYEELSVRSWAGTQPIFEAGKFTRRVTTV